MVKGEKEGKECSRSCDRKGVSEGGKESVRKGVSEEEKKSEEI
jgi:hypothetical protein